jgi:rubrerythrin
MDEHRRELLDALRKAIEAEYEGHGFYLMAARTTTDAQGRRTFETMAQEELHHADFLKANYRAIGETGRVAPAAALGTPGIAGRSAIFSTDLRARIGEAHFEMSALSVGVQLERAAIDFYRHQADRATDPPVRDFFGRLAEWESTHYHALLEQQETLKEDYWRHNGFAPF